MCNFGGSSTNTNQIIRGQSRLSFAKDFGDMALDGMGESVEKPKSTQKSKLTASDNYQG